MPNLDQKNFCILARQYNIIPIIIELPTDLETPISLYSKLVGESQGFMLESAESGKAFGRYSFLGMAPFLKIRGFKTYAEVETETTNAKLEGNPLEILQTQISKFCCPVMDGLPPFAGGAVGYFAYELAAVWERIRGLEIAADAVLFEVMFCRIIVAVDNLTHSTKLIYLAQVDPAQEASLEYEKGIQNLEEMAGKIRSNVQYYWAANHEHERAVGAAAAAYAPGEAKEEFVSKVRRAKQYIAAGDIFQAVLSQTFRRTLTKSPFNLYRRLRQINPSPYMFYLNFGSRKLAGASPERLVKLEDGRITTNPIAGTRPRGKDAAEDAILADELLADEKERAEHAMLVDLGRNDIGRVSIPGTVELTRLMEVEQYSHVMHIVSEVSGLARPDVSPVDILAACLPAGTVSGAPKPRAMEIIAELEQAGRGAYAGAVGYIDFRGGMDTCITIRTFVIDDNEVVLQTGAGIVADSVPEKEFEEVLHKAGVLFKVLTEE